MLPLHIKGEHAQQKYRTKRDQSGRKIRAFTDTHQTIYSCERSASNSVPGHAVPVVSVALYYDVGSRNEKEGSTGFAHLFEHMMFQGSENVPKAAHFQYIFNAGGTMNGTTSTERTNYFETLPASHLPLALA